MVQTRKPIISSVAIRSIFHIYHTLWCLLWSFIVCFCLISTFFYCCKIYKASRERYILIKWDMVSSLWQAWAQIQALNLNCSNTDPNIDPNSSITQGVSLSFLDLWHIIECVSQNTFIRIQWHFPRSYHK